MDWNSLKILALVAHKGSMSGAAKELGVNYTTVFRRMESLENEIGGKLFERGSKGYVATPLAEKMLVFANRMRDGAEQIERQIVGREFQPSGVVKITAPFNIANRYLPEALRPLAQDYPDITFEILSSNDDFNLNSRVADIAVRATSSPPDHLIGRKVASIPWAMFVAESFMERFAQPPTLETLADYPLIGASGSMLNLPAFTWLEKNHATAIVARCNELTAMSYCAESGHGIAFLPVDQRRSGLVELAEFAPGKTSDMWVLSHPDLKKTERIRIVVEQLVSYFRSLDF
ncbi:LysR family transcriptional regulator [Hahella sp. HN01]|uniref:LysR family transcriptional regulator n=1 Tax=Hahella sp. HN01 TaxID=2847262 RepID=UPI001C1E8ECA|nr:LysR family transcriptional regulator [Hahella sp. HN01]MBU6955603.1 LysR family transcriptional regulator [Hahella sp. HN01]